MSDTLARLLASGDPEIGAPGFDVLPEKPRPGIALNWCKEYWRKIAAVLDLGWRPMSRIEEAETCFIWARPNDRGGWGVGIGYRTVSGTYLTETSQPLPKDVVCWKNIGLSPDGN